MNYMHIFCLSQAASATSDLLPSELTVGNAVPDTVTQYFTWVNVYLNDFEFYLHDVMCSSRHQYDQYQQPELSWSFKDPATQRVV